MFRISRGIQWPMTNLTIDMMVKQIVSLIESGSTRDSRSDRESDGKSASRCNWESDSRCDRNSDSRHGDGFDGRSDAGSDNKSDDHFAYENF